MPVHVSSEIGRLRSVLVHLPGPELLAVTPATRHDSLSDATIAPHNAHQATPPTRALLSPPPADGSPAPAGIISQLVAYTGLPGALWSANLSMGPDLYRASLLSGKMIGRYDARVNAPNGSALTADGDPSLTVVNATFTNSGAR